jgi:hypothetical protein
LEYHTVREILTTEEFGTYTTYGIIGVENLDDSVIVFVPDVSTDRTFVEDLARKCTEGCLSPIHLKDVIEDEII